MLANKNLVIRTHTHTTQVNKYLERKEKHTINLVTLTHILVIIIGHSKRERERES